MTDTTTDKSPSYKAGDVIWKKVNAGFVGVGSFAVLIDIDDDDPFPCVFDCGNADCREWNTLWLVEADNIDEANRAVEAERFAGAAYHVAECQMSQDKEEAH